MGKLEKYVFGEARVRNLVFGIFAISVAVGLVLLCYGYLSGMASEGEDIILKSEGVGWLLLYGFFVLVLGLLGGFEIGRYAQTEFTKRRKRD